MLGIQRHPLAEGGLQGFPGIGNWTNGCRLPLGGLCEHVSQWVSEWAGLLLYWGWGEMEKVFRATHAMGHETVDSEGMETTHIPKVPWWVAAVKWQLGLFHGISRFAMCLKTMTQGHELNSVIPAQFLGRWHCFQITAETVIRWILGSATITCQRICYLAETWAGKLPLEFFSGWCQWWDQNQKFIAKSSVKWVYLWLCCQNCYCWTCHSVHTYPLKTVLVRANQSCRLAA